MAGAAHTAFLLLVVWWAWIYTTWMVNWFDPAFGAVRLVIVGAALASLLMSAAIPSAFGTGALLFAGSYVALQVGRNLAGAVLLSRDHALRDTFERILAWSLASGVLWIVGALVPSSVRFALWGPALAIDLAAPIAGYWTPGRGRSLTSDYTIDGGHFAERFQAFIIIALGESIVVTGATASSQGLSTTVVFALAVAFLSTGACGGSTSARSLSTRAVTWRQRRIPGVWRVMPIPICTCRSWPASSWWRSGTTS